MSFQTWKDEYLAGMYDLFNGDDQDTLELAQFTKM